MKFATYFDRKEWNFDSGTMNEMESLTDESFASMCDVNCMLMAGRVVPRVPPAERFNMNNYEIDSIDFDEWVNIKATIERKFLHLSPEAKMQFGSPQEFFKYATNPENYEFVGGKIVEKQILETPVVIPEILGQTGEKTGQTTEQK